MAKKKFKVRKAELLDALNLSSLALNKGDEDVNSHFLFKIKENELTIHSANNMSLTQIKIDNIKILDDDKEIKEYSFTLRGENILGLLSTLKKDNDIVIEFDKENMNILINDTYDFPSLDPDDFTDFEKDLEEATSISDIEVDVLSDSIKYIQGFIGNDPQGRPELTVAPILDKSFLASNSKTFGVYESDKLNAEGFEVACTSIGGIQKFIRRATSSISLEEEEVKEEPKKAAKKAAKKAKKEEVVDESADAIDISDVIEEEETAEIKENKTTETAVAVEEELKKEVSKVSLLKSKNFYILSSIDKKMYYGYRKSSHKFPAKKLQQNIESGKKASTKIKLPRTKLIEVINRLSYCIDGASQRMTFDLNGDEDEATLKISVMGSHKRTTTEELPVSRLTGKEDLSFSVNYEHLQRTLPLYESPEIIVALSKGKALTITDELDNRSLYGVIALLRSV